MFSSLGVMLLRGKFALRKPYVIQTKALRKVKIYLKYYTATIYHVRLSQNTIIYFKTFLYLFLLLVI